MTALHLAAPRPCKAKLARHRPGPGGAVHTLHPGEVAVAGAGERLETLLGSCIAVVLTDPRRTVGAMCHIVHSPSQRANPANALPHESGAYGDVAFDTLYALLRERSITPHLCEAYVFGGGNMFPALGFEPGAAVGDDNARWALDALAAEGIRVLHLDVGGTVYRKLVWTVGPDAPQVIAVPV